jgi:hypothetical protein
MRKQWSRSAAMWTFVIATLSTSARAAIQEWTAEDRETWKKAVKRVVTTPPCCGACAVVSISDGRKAYKYIAGEEKSEEGAEIYKEHDKRFLEAFQFLNPSRYQHWFGKKQKEKNTYEK